VHPQAVDAGAPAGGLRAQGLFGRVRETRRELEPFERELLELKGAGKFVEFLRLAVPVAPDHRGGGKTGSGKTTFMKGLVEEVPAPSDSSPSRTRPS
jgi:hypothetical protein